MDNVKKEKVFSVVLKRENWLYLRNLSTEKEKSMGKLINELIEKSINKSLSKNKANI